MWELHQTQMHIYFYRLKQKKNNEEHHSHKSLDFSSKNKWKIKNKLHTIWLVILRMNGWIMKE